MANYEYDALMEAFRRDDKRGRPLYINITEAQRIESLLNLGHSVAQIEGKVSLSSPMASSTTVRNFIKNLKEGKITIPSNAPAPVRDFEELTVDGRMTALENRVEQLEAQMSEIKSDCFCTALATTSEKNRFDKIKGWFKL